MSARDDLAYAAGAFTPARTVTEMLDAYRAEVLSEAARLVSGLAQHCDDCDFCTGVDEAAGRLRRMAAEAGETA